MGMPTCLAAILEGERSNFRTIFYAHEVAPMRRIVEHSPGHDTMFYNVMRSAISQGHYLEDVFGDQSGYYKHAMVKASRFCDGIFAVGDYVLKEIRFLGPDFLHVDSQIAYNGIPCWKISSQERMASRQKLRAYCNTLLGYEPDYVFSHVTRLVPSKGLWRDLRVLEHVERILRDRNETAVMYTLSTEVPSRRGDDIRRMEQHYHWPVVHREGLPDLSNGEAAYYQGVQEFNARSRNVKVVFINQFGFEQKVCGMRMPADMEFMDLPQRLGCGIWAEHLRAVRHRAGGADQLRRDLRVQQRVRMRWVCRQGGGRKTLAECHRRGLHRTAQQGPAARAVDGHRPAAAG